jgi:hypothetical protein
MSDRKSVKFFRLLKIWAARFILLEKGEFLLIEQQYLLLLDLMYSGVQAVDCGSHGTQKYISAA